MESAKPKAGFPLSHRPAYANVPDAWIFGDGFAVLVESKIAVLPAAYTHAADVPRDTRRVQRTGCGMPGEGETNDRAVAAPQANQGTGG
jgi:hypothetical protein